MSLLGSPHLYAVILAGGSGTRFWPASRRLRPKQLLPLSPSSSASLIRDTVNRVQAWVSPARILIATGAHLVAATKQELPELSESSFLAEPCPKNTAPCIAWATSVIAERDPEAVIMVLPSDQYVADPEGLQQVIARAVAAAEQGPITTVGIVPTRPETGYGYVELGEERSAGVHRVERFVEKPDAETARQYLESGRYLWNSGMFFFRAQEMLRALRQHLPDLAEGVARLASTPEPERPAAIASLFETTEAVSIDYGVMEREPELNVVPGRFGWNDLGSWQSAWDVADKDEHGNAFSEEAVLVDARNNLVVDLTSKDGSSEKRTIALVGVDDLCVVDTDDALLIMPRHRSQDVRQVVAELERRKRSDRV